MRTQEKIESVLNKVLWPKFHENEKGVNTVDGYEKTKRDLDRMIKILEWVLEYRDLDFVFCDCEPPSQKPPDLRPSRL